MRRRSHESYPTVPPGDERFERKGQFRFLCDFKQVGVHIKEIIEWRIANCGPSRRRIVAAAAMESWYEWVESRVDESKFYDVFHDAVCQWRLWGKGKPWELGSVRKAKRSRKRVKSGQ